MFAKGQKVVCINDEFPPMARLMFKALPGKDVVDTARAIYIGRCKYTRTDSAQQHGEIGVLLEELVNPRDPSMKAGLNGELGFNSERFAPLESDTEDAERVAEKEDLILLPA